MVLLEAPPLVKDEGDVAGFHVQVAEDVDALADVALDAGLLGGLTAFVR